MYCDRFTRNAVILLILMILLIILSFGPYVGGEMKGTVESVKEKIPAAGGQEGMTSFPAVNTLGASGEFVCFTLAGMVSGFIIGYYWSSVFGREDDV
ncbi:MAG: hypothetical protein LUP99_05110 [Methanomicrobiales archaeon]|nr:hypothetical protein [Methanomicrobiales archaeon]